MSGYAEQGWTRVRWLLQHLPARESPRRSGNAGAEEENVGAWAEGYRARFNDGLAQEVIGGVVSVVDAASLQDLARLLALISGCLLYTSPSPRDKRQSRMPSSA